MVSFDGFKAEGNSPIYVELVQYLKRQMIAHEIKNEDPLPSRREVSARLGINPNTVQKAYKILEDEGLIESRSGAKSCVSVNDEIINRLKKELMESEVVTMVRAMREMGIEKEEAIRLLESVWEEQ